MPTVSLPAPLARRSRHSSSDVASALVRRSVGALSAGRHTCRHCHRTPLVGECVYVYGGDLVCELCLPLRSGSPDRSLLVRSPEQAGAVRMLARPT